MPASTSFSSAILSATQGACNSRSAGAAVRLDDVAVNPDGALAVAFEIGDCAQRASDQAFYSVSASTGRPFVTSRGVRVKLARGSMLYSLEFQPLPRLRMNSRHRFFD